MLAGWHARSVFLYTQKHRSNRKERQGEPQPAGSRTQSMQCDASRWAGPGLFRNLWSRKPLIGFISEPLPLLLKPTDCSAQCRGPCPSKRYTNAIDFVSE